MSSSCHPALANHRPSYGHFFQMQRLAAVTLSNTRSSKGHLVDVPHDSQGPLPGLGSPAVEHHLVQMANPRGAGQPVAPQVLAGRLHPPTPRLGGGPPAVDLPETGACAPYVTLDAGSDFLATQHPLQLLEVEPVHLASPGSALARPPRSGAWRGQPRYVAAQGPGCHPGCCMSTSVVTASKQPNLPHLPLILNLPLSI